MSGAEKHLVRVGATRFAKADAANVYAIVEDSAGYPDWSAIGAFEEEKPGITTRFGVGSVRIFRTLGFVLREEIVEAVPHARISYRLLSGFPLKGYVSEIDIRPEAGQTRIDWYSSFVPPTGFGWFWRSFMQVIIAGISKALVVEAERRAGQKPQA